MEKNNQFSHKEIVYKNVSTAPPYIKIKFKSPETGEIMNMIVENEHMASYLANKRGIKIDKLGKGAYTEFIETEYVKYMTENEGKVLDIDINDFKKFIGKVCFSNKKTGEKYVNSLIFNAPLALQDLKVNNDKELIDKYFDFNSERGFGTLKKEYYKQFSSNPAFIALLIDLGYNVGRGDIVPILWIRTNNK